MIAQLPFILSLQTACASILLISCSCLILAYLFVLPLLLLLGDCSTSIIWMLLALVPLQLEGQQAKCCIAFCCCLRSL